MDICVWPSEPSNNDCDQDAYAQTNGSATLGSVGELLNGVPELDGVEFKAEDSIQEGGRHFFFTSEYGPSSIVGAYERALENAGWKILSSGGDPFGLFGAGLSASDGTRYISLNAGGPAGSTFVDACIWPAQPSDTNCGQNQNARGNAQLGSGGSLLDNVPALQTPPIKHRTAFRRMDVTSTTTTTNAPADVAGAYQTALENNGWAIKNSGGGGDPFGLFASGAGLTATNGSRYLKLNAGGPIGSTHVDICVWPSQPVDDDCGQNNNRTNRVSNGNAPLGSSAGLLNGVPALSDAEFKSENPIQSSGRHFFFMSTTVPQDVVETYSTALTNAGWTVESAGGGGDPFGLFGSGAGLTATDGTRVIKLNAGGPPVRHHQCVHLAQRAGQRQLRTEQQLIRIAICGDRVHRKIRSPPDSHVHCHLMMKQFIVATGLLLIIALGVVVVLPRRDRWHRPIPLHYIDQSTCNLTPRHIRIGRYPVPPNPDLSEIEGETVVCGILTVPEDYGKPEGNHVELVYAILRSTSLASAGDPVVYLHGGPGSAEMRQLAQLTERFESLRRTRDVIVFDQRGTGYSNNRLACDVEYATQQDDARGGLDALSNGSDGNNEVAVNMLLYQVCLDRFEAVVLT